MAVWPLYGSNRPHFLSDLTTSTRPLSKSPCEILHAQREPQSEDQVVLIIKEHLRTPEHQQHLAAFDHSIEDCSSRAGSSTSRAPGGRPAKTTLTLIFRMPNVERAGKVPRIRFSQIRHFSA